MIGSIIRYYLKTNKKSEKEDGEVLISAGIMHDQIFNVSTQLLVFFFLTGSPATTGRKSLAYT